MALCLRASCLAKALSSPTAARRRAQASARRPATHRRAVARPASAAGGAGAGAGAGAGSGATTGPSPGRWSVPLPPGTADAPAGTPAEEPAVPEVDPELARQVAAALAAACGIPPDDAAGLAPHLVARGPEFCEAVQQHSGTVAGFLQSHGVAQPELAALALRRPKLFSMPPERHLSLLVQMGLPAEEAARFMARQRSQLLSDGFHVHTAVTAEERQERIANLRRRGLTPRQLLTAYLHSEQALLDHPPGFFEDCYNVLSPVLGMGSKSAIAVIKRCPPLRSDAEVSAQSIAERAQALAQRYGREAALKMVEAQPSLLTEQLSSALPPALQRWEAVLRQCGVQQPERVLSSFAGRLNYDALDPRALANRLALERCMRLSAAEVYSHYAGLLRPLSSAYPAARLAGRLALLERRGLLALVVPDKWAALQQWRHKRGLPHDASQPGEPRFISLSEVANKSDDAFFELPALRGSANSAAGGAAGNEAGSKAGGAASGAAGEAAPAGASTPSASASGESAPADRPADGPDSSPLREAWTAFLAAGREEAVRLRSALPDELRPALEPFFVRLKVRDERYQ